MILKHLSDREFADQFYIVAKRSRHKVYRPTGLGPGVSVAGFVALIVLLVLDVGAERHRRSVIVYC
jgi:hypothetical protein